MKKILLYIFIIVVIFGVITLIYKRTNTSSQNNGKLQITASFYPLYFFASQIGGAKADVKNITPAAAEPHDYEPTTQDIARMEKSNMLILNGAVEAWGDKIKDNLKGTNVEVVTAGDGLLTRQLVEKGKTAKDPHVWLNPELAKKEAAKITEGFVKIDPKNISYYQTNEKALDDKLDQLDAEYKAGLASCQKKDIITSHAAFAYMGARYGLNQIAIAGLSPDEEPSAQQLADVANFAKKNNVKYIFFESLISPKLSQTIANEIGAQTLVLDPLEGISENDMEQGKNYFIVMADNLKSLQQALACKK